MKRYYVVSLVACRLLVACVALPPVFRLQNPDEPAIVHLLTTS